jgi:hypothetical protein
MPALASIAFPVTLPAIPIPKRLAKPSSEARISIGRFTAVPQADTNATRVKWAGLMVLVMNQRRLCRGAIG